MPAPLHVPFYAEHIEFLCANSHSHCCRSFLVCILHLVYPSLFGLTRVTLRLPFRIPPRGVTSIQEVKSHSYILPHPVAGSHTAVPLCPLNSSSHSTKATPSCRARKPTVKGGSSPYGFVSTALSTSLKSSGLGCLSLQFLSLRVQTKRRPRLSSHTVACR